MGCSFSHCDMTLSYGMRWDFGERLKESAEYCFMDHPVETFYEDEMTPEQLKEMLPFLEKIIPTWKDSDDPHDYDGYLKAFGLEFIEGVKRAIKNNESIKVS